MNQDRLQEMLAASRQTLDFTPEEVEAASGLRFVLSQRFAYTYSGPVQHLHQRLLAFPPGRHGDQRRVFHQLAVDPGGPLRRWATDAHGNVVASIEVPAIEQTVRFDVHAVIDRAPRPEDARVPLAAVPTYLEPTRLTQPDAGLRAAAHQLAGHSDFETVERLCQFVHSSVRYQKGVTSVDTTAAEAFALGAGVCQDQAQVMLAMCRALGIPARYVSGHMLGEGATHAWVEVLLPDATDAGLARAMPFDPCHGRRPDASYITIATGRDYSDVPPTSGSYTGRAANHLTSFTLLGVTLLS